MSVRSESLTRCESGFFDHRICSMLHPHASGTGDMTTIGEVMGCEQRIGEITGEWQHGDVPTGRDKVTQPGWPQSSAVKRNF